jgi:Putative prokaryotic signal transducing protein
MEFKLLASFDNYLLANMTLGMLQENDINCHLKDEYIVTTDPLLNAAVGGIKIMVEESQFARAQELLKEAEAGYLATIPCPNCSHLTLEAEEKVNQPGTFWGKVKNMIAYGQESTHKKIYRCSNCQSVFTDLPM